MEKIELCLFLHVKKELLHLLESYRKKPRVFNQIFKRYFLVELVRFDQTTVNFQLYYYSQLNIFV